MMGKRMKDTQGGTSNQLVMYDINKGWKFQVNSSCMSATSKNVDEQLLRIQRDDSNDKGYGLFIWSLP